MSLKSTLAGLFVIVALCGAGLYALQATFGRDAEMRGAERDFFVANSDAIQARQEQLRAEHDAANGADWDTPDEGFASAEDAAPSLDEWYAAAGAGDGPADVTPEDKSYLINEAEPTSDGEPIF